MAKILFFLALSIAIVILLNTNLLIIKLNKIQIENPSTVLVISLFIFFIIKAFALSQLFFATLMCFVFPIVYQTAVIDNKYRLIPDKYPILLFLIGFILCCARRQFLKIAIVIILFVMIIVVVTVLETIIKKDIIGGGDIKLLLALALIFTTSEMTVILFAMQISFFICILRKKIKSAPLAPFVFIGLFSLMFLKGLIF